MSRRKMFVAAFMLTFLLLVGSTMAYLTDVDSKSNVFTFGNVNIELVEPHWVPANGLNVIPGQTIAKDPKINNIGSTNAYVFMDVHVPCVGNKPVLSYTVNSGWTKIQEGACVSGSKYIAYAYGSSTTMTSLAPNASTPTLFDSVTIVDLDSSEIEQLTGNISMDITALAVQADGNNTSSGHSDNPTTLRGAFALS